MSTKICPRCQQRYVQPRHNGDYVHQCHSGNNTLDQEDVFVVGDWEDYTGSAEISPTTLRVAGMQTTNWGRRSFIENEKVHKRTSRGNKKVTHRQRKHLEYIQGDNNA